MPSLAVALTLMLLGRPVYQDKTLAELATESHFVLEVEKATPFTGSRNAEGCEEKLWHVTVKEVLSVGPSIRGAMAPPKPGATLDVVVNPIELFDCMARKKSRSGVSFSAPRYTPTATEPGQRFLIFVNATQRGYIFTAQRAWEGLEKKSELTNKPSNNLIR